MLRVLAEETKEKHKAECAEAERKLVHHRRLHAEDIERHRAQLDQWKHYLAQKDTQIEEERRVREKERDQWYQKGDEEKKMAIQASQEHDRFISLWAEEKKRLMEQVAQAKDNNDSTQRALESLRAEMEVATKEEVSRAEEFWSEIELLNTQLCEAHREKEKAVQESQNIKQLMEEKAVSQKAVSVKDDFEPLWSTDFGPPSPVSWGALKEIPASPKSNRENERLRKQNEDLRAVISRMTTDAQQFAQQEDSHKLRQKESECAELRQRNWHLKQDNDRLSTGAFAVNGTVQRFTGRLSDEAVSYSTRACCPRT